MQTATEKQLTVKVLNVIAESAYDGSNYTFKALEFSTGLVLVPGESTNDWFFRNREEIVACGNDEIIEVVDTDVQESWTKTQLLKSVAGSVYEFGPEQFSNGDWTNLGELLLDRATELEQILRSSKDAEQFLDKND